MAKAVLQSSSNMNMDNWTNKGLNAGTDEDHNHQPLGDARAWSHHHQYMSEPQSYARRPRAPPYHPRNYAQPQHQHIPYPIHMMTSHQPRHHQSIDAEHHDALGPPEEDRKPAAVPTHDSTITAASPADGHSSPKRLGEGSDEHYVSPFGLPDSDDDDDDDDVDGAERPAKRVRCLSEDDDPCNIPAVARQNPDEFFAGGWISSHDLAVRSEHHHQQQQQQLYPHYGETSTTEKPAVVNKFADSFFSMPGIHEPSPVDDEENLRDAPIPMHHTHGQDQPHSHPHPHSHLHPYLHLHPPHSHLHPLSLHPHPHPHHPLALHPARQQHEHHRHPAYGRRSKRKSPPIETSRMQTSSGEGTRQVRFEPTAEELQQATTPRARQALDTWYQRLTELYQYKQFHGDCNVPQKYKENPQLGIWVNKQRMEKKFMDEDQKTSMTHARVDALNQLGFIWAKRKGQHSWDAKYAELVDFHAIHGHCNVATKYKPNPALGRWVSTQRSQYKEYIRNEQTHMTQDRLDKLRAIGFKFDMMRKDDDDDVG